MSVLHKKTTGPTRALASTLLTSRTPLPSAGGAASPARPSEIDGHAQSSFSRWGSDAALPAKGVGAARLSSAHVGGTGGLDGVRPAPPSVDRIISPCAPSSHTQ
jgi:hypothetical protein